MSPTVRYITRCAMFGVAGAVPFLLTAIPIGVQDLEVALLTGLGAAFAYAGIGAATPLEPKIGAKS